MLRKCKQCGKLGLYLNPMNIEQTLVDGSTYAGSVKDSLINYLLIFFNFLPVKFATSSPRIKWGAYWVVIIFLVLQIALWFTIGAIGVSLIWCALAGINLIQFIRDISNRSMLLIGSLIIALAGIAYYALTLYMIVTVAHVLAFALGAGLFYLFTYERIAKKG